MSIAVSVRLVKHVFYNQKNGTHVPFALDAKDLQQ